MAVLLDLITVQQFRQMPDDGEAHELHHGDVVAVTRPKAKHYQLQRRLVRLLGDRLAGFGQVGMEFPYRPVAEFDLRVADVAAVSQARYDRIDPDDNLHGAPEASGSGFSSLSQRMLGMLDRGSRSRFGYGDPARRFEFAVRFSAKCSAISICRR